MCFGKNLAYTCYLIATLVVPSLLYKNRTSNILALSLNTIQSPLFSHREDTLKNGSAVGTGNNTGILYRRSENNIGIEEDLSDPG